MATHSSILAWRIPWTEEPGGLHSWGRKESDTTEQLSTAQHSICVYTFVHVCINKCTCMYTCLWTNMTLYTYTHRFFTAEPQEVHIYILHTQWHPTLVLLPGKSHARRSLVGCSPWGCKELDTTERLLSLFTFLHWRRKWQPTPLFLPGESQGWQSLVGCCLWGRTESDTTEAT